MIMLIMSLYNRFTAHTTLQYPQDPNPSIPAQNLLVSSIYLQAAHADISPAHGVLIPVRKNTELGSRHSYDMYWC
jgi:hypothetical protein